MSILLKIRRLKKDLSAVVVVEEEEWHTEVDEKYLVCDGGGHSQGNWDPAAGDSFLPKKFVVDKPAVIACNISSYRAARSKLQEIYDNSRWYQFLRRYFVERAIDSVLNPKN
jgi:hypothetical protein